MSEFIHPASFRDPSGFIFSYEGVLLRAVTERYRAQYEKLMATGLYGKLVKHGMLIPHEEVPVPSILNDRQVCHVLRPEIVPFVSYPYEWCFSQLKDAALLTLKIQQQSLASGMVLKDASAYNIQFLRGKPVMIDTLSFADYQEGEPWVAYRQFCQHFLAPLALMSQTDIRLNQLLRVYLDGIPLDLASRLLPGRTKLSLNLGAHIHLHARSQRQYADRQNKATGRKMTRMAYLGLMNSLEAAVNKLTWKPTGTEWAEYYDMTNYSDKAFAQKERLVAGYLERLNPGIVWDLGANTGVFSRIPAQRGVLTIASDIDPAAVERNYLDCRSRNERNILPLVLDLTNPSPCLGWQNRERMSMIERGPADAVLALALVHHLAIGNNVPFPRIVEFFAQVGKALVIEFIPKDDSQVQRLLATREDIFTDYTQSEFEQAFSTRFNIIDQTRVSDSRRVLYLMQRKSEA